jgi:ubiquinone biosynthesis protein
MQSTIKKLQEKAPELLKEIPELPSLVLDALKQMNNISNIQNEQTKSDNFHTKMLQNALWCQITLSKCMLCNILE